MNAEKENPLIEFMYLELNPIFAKIVRLSYMWKDNASVNSSSAHLPPSPRADPRELAFFENELANAPPPGQKSCSNAPG